jgi:hypothetical protein
MWGCSWGSIITVIPLQPHKLPPNDVINPGRVKWPTRRAKGFSARLVHGTQHLPWQLSSAHSFLEKKRHHERTRSSPTLICRYHSTRCSFHPRIQLSPPLESCTLCLSSVRQALRQVFLRALRFPFRYHSPGSPHSCFVYHDSSRGNWRR